MLRIKTDFKIGIPEKVQNGYAILKALEGNPHFPPPIPIVDEFTAGLELLEKTSREAVYGGRNKTSVMYLAEEAYDELMMGLIGYVHSVSKGDAAIAIGAGFEVRGGRTMSLPPVTPQPPLAIPGSREGEVRLKWTPVRGARTYFVRVSKDGGQSWEDCGAFTRSRVIVSGLEPNSTPLFAVSAISTRGQSGWSNAAQGKVA